MKYGRVATYRKALYKFPLPQLKNYHIRSYLDVLLKVSKDSSMFVALYKDGSEFFMHISDKEDIIEDVGAHTLIVYQNMLDIIRDQGKDKLETYVNMVCNLILLDVNENHNKSRRKTIIYYKEDLESVLRSNKVGYEYIYIP